MTIDDGEFVALVGPSGCGKTTTLNMVAGLIELTSGTITIGGKVVNELDPKDRDIAMVFQNYALYPSKTVERQSGVSPADAQGAEGRDRRGASRRPPRSSGFSPCCTAVRASSRAASSSALRSAARWCAIRKPS